ncbi:transposable element Tcb2 transposase [Trichonephila clavipes]|nr:transposable element Tcb2 transposase [Trichonephila clavipes]
MDLPAYSPDLNPIKHVWDMLGRQPPPTCLPELRWALLDEWCNIPQDQIDNLILSMPSRCGRDSLVVKLNGYVNKQNCRIWSEANLQVYVETPLHPEKLTVWCALWAGGILLQKRGRPQRYSQW